MKRLRYDQAHLLMDRTDAQLHPIPFHLKWRTVTGRAVEADCEKVVSYNRVLGCRRIILRNGGFRNVYDVLIRQVDDTKIVVG